MPVALAITVALGAEVGSAGTDVALGAEVGSADTVSAGGMPVTGVALHAASIRMAITVALCWMK